MSYQIKNGSTAYPLVFMMVDSADHVSAKTGLSPTVTLSKAGGSFASPAGAVSEIGSGWYKVAGNAADSNTNGPLILHATASGADPTDILYEVVAYDPQDSNGLGLTNLDATVSSRASQASVNTVDDFLDTEIASILSTLGTPAGASVSADIAAVKSETASILTDTAEIGAAGAGLTAVPWNSAWGSQIAGSVWDAATATYGSAGSYGLLIETNLDAQVSTVGGGSLTEAGIADAVWDEILSGHAGVGSTGAALSAAGGSGDPWSTALPGAYGSGTAGNIIGSMIDAAISSRASQASVDTVDDLLDTEIAAIKSDTGAILADTNELQTDWANGGRLDLILDARASQTSVDTVDDFLDTEIAAIKAKTDNLPADPADASDIAASFTTINTKLDTIDDFLDTEIAAIKAKTDGLPADPADASDIAASFTTVNTKLDTIDDLLDTEVAAIYSRIGAPAGASIAADIAAVQSDTNDLQARIPAALTAGGNMKSDALAISGSTSAADNLEAHALRAVQVTFSGGGTTTTAVLANVDGAAASSTDDVYNGRVLVFSAPAALKDQACSITDYVGATKTATLSGLTAAVDGTAAAVLV